jgi:hypothetical protein
MPQRRRRRNCISTQNKGGLTTLQKSLTDNFPQVVYKKSDQRVLPHIDEVTAETPCMLCEENLKPSSATCNPVTCDKLSAWLGAP